MPGNGATPSHTLAIVLLEIDHQPRHGNSATAFVSKSQKVILPAQRFQLRHRETYLLAADINANAFATLTATARKNLAAILCCHAAAKTMSGFATFATGLKGSFHVSFTPGYDG